MKINLTSVFVDDQAKALDFYTKVMGFLPSHDVPVGQFRWLTVVSPENPQGTELLLEPDDNPAAKAYKQSLFQQGIPAAAFEVEDIQAEYARLDNLGVSFHQPPADMGTTFTAVLDDTCGNLIQLYQMKKT